VNRHRLTTAVGLVPVVGEAADLANAAWCTKFPRGLEFEWTGPGPNPTTYQFRAHDLDPAAPPGSNANSGPVYRISDDAGNCYDAAGKPYPPEAFERKHPLFDPNAANNTHIPYPSDLPAPGGRTISVAVSSPTSILGPEHDHGGAAERAGA
jgi:hypothetical protein